MQTAQIALDSQSLNIIEDDLFLEVDYGSWSGEKISTLANDPLWSIVQKQPSNAKFPDGESLLNMSQRANQGFDSIIQSHKSTDVIAIFSHADIIKAIISHQIGNDFNNYQKLMIDNAKVNILHLKESEMALAGMNLPVSDFTLSLIGKE
jgi:broad specificity phosphatase PhoE